MSKSHYSSNSANVALLKCVVSCSGHVVAKNYSRDDLRSGDLGLELRVDRGKLEEMTPEQRNAAQSVGREMSEEFLKTLGVETDSEGFKPGMLVSLKSRDTKHSQPGVNGLSVGWIVNINETSVSIRCIYYDKPLGTTRLQMFPLNLYEMTEEVPLMPGYEGLLLHELPWWWQYTDDEIDTFIDNHPSEEFIIKLAMLPLLQQIPQRKLDKADSFLFMQQERAIQRIRDRSVLKKISEQDGNKDVREAAAQQLAKISQPEG